MTVDEMVKEGFYSEEIGAVRNALKNRRRLENSRRNLQGKLLEAQTELVTMEEAQKVLSTVSDDNTERTLDQITAVVNKALAEMFTTDTPRIGLKRTLHAGVHPHIKLELYDGHNNVLDMAIQSGVGLSQVVSFMYSISLIEIRKGRRFLILDERLNGLHKEAKRVISEIIKIFADGGFQFIFVEYGLNNMGKIYNVEKHGEESVLVSLNGAEYDESKVYVDDVDLSLLNSDD